MTITNKHAQSAQRAFDELASIIVRRTDTCGLGAGIINYGELGQLIGFQAPAGMPMIEPVKYIYSYCRMNELPLMNANVVRKDTNQPGWDDMFKSEAELLDEQDKVLHFEWGYVHRPSVEDLMHFRKAHLSRL